VSTNDHFVLGVDLDGVCADYQGAFKELVARESGWALEDFPEQTTWAFGDSGWPVRDEQHYLELHHRGVTEDRLFTTLREIKGASDTLWRLSDLGVHIRIVTHRLFLSWEHADVVAQTVEWLQQPRSDGRPLIPYRDLCFMGNKTDVGADLYVDDAPHNVAALRDSHSDVIIFDQPYNREISGLRAYTWDDVENIVRGRVAERGL